MKRTEKSKEIETYETKNADLESGRPRNYIFDRPSFAKWNFIWGPSINDVTLERGGGGLPKRDKQY